jgi:hypothetical protein
VGRVREREREKEKERDSKRGAIFVSRQHAQTGKGETERNF